MTFQRNVRATFDVARFAKRASVVALAATFFTSVAIGRSSDPVVAYLLFFFSMVLVALIHTDRTKTDILAHPSFDLRAIWRPLAFAVPLILAVYLVLWAGLRFPVSGGSAVEKVWPSFFAGVLVGFTEEFARWVWLQVLPYGIVTGNLLWVLLHPQVAVIFAGSLPNFLFATFALAFGLAMTAVMWGYESRLGGFNRYLGPVAAMVLHGGYNVLVTLWAVSVAGVTFGVM